MQPRHTVAAELDSTKASIGIATSAHRACLHPHAAVEHTSLGKPDSSAHTNSRGQLFSTDRTEGNSPRPAHQSCTGCTDAEVSCKQRSMS